MQAPEHAARTPGDTPYSALVDAVRLCFGLLTVLPVGQPRRFGGGRAGAAMSMAPLAGLAVGLAAGLAVLVADLLGLSGLLVGAAAVGAGAAMTRLLHLDGVADTADGMAAVPHGGDPDRALEVMRRGDVGPAGVATLVLVVLAQVGAVAAVTAQHSRLGLVITVATAWFVSRAILPVLCLPRFAMARPGGLGATVLRTVKAPAAVTVVVVVALVAAVATGWQGGLVALLALAAGAAVAVLVARRIGGLTGDVLGAAVEVTLLADLALRSSTLLS